MPTLRDLYAFLGITKEATSEEIRRAYYRAARRLHPDVNLDPAATELFLRIQEAYEVISDPLKRNNYDIGQEPERILPSPVSLTTLFSRTILSNIQEPQLIYALMDIAAPKETGLEKRNGSSPPLNLCLVIDRSTSMRGERIDTAKATAIQILRQLRAQDIFSIVVFSDRAEVLLPASQNQDRKRAETQVQMIRTGGGTELFHGLQAGIQELRRNQGKNFLHHLILLTDGRTYGDEKACLQLVDQTAAQAIGITGLGIGEEWNDVFLDQLVTPTGGSSLYVSKAVEIQNFIQEKITELGRVYATSVELQLETGRGVDLQDAYRLQPAASPLPNKFPLRLGNLTKSGNISVLLEFVVSPIPGPAQNISLAFGEITLDLPNRQPGTLRLPVNLTRQVSGLPNIEYPPEVILQAISRITLYKLQDRARKEAATSNITAAGKKLQQLARHLIAQGQNDLAQTALLEAEYLNRVKALSAEGQKRIKYGTRSLLPPSGGWGKEN